MLVWIIEIRVFLRRSNLEKLKSQIEISKTLEQDANAYINAGENILEVSLPS